MKLNLKTVLTGSAATIALLAASSANASGYYIGLFGGISTMEDSFTVGSGTGGGGTVSLTKTASATFTFGTNVGAYTTTGGGTTGTGTGKAGSVTVGGWAQFAFDTMPNNTTAGTFTGATGFTGIHFDQYRTSISRYTRSTAFGATNDFDDGFVVGAAIGWDFGTGWRGELEAAYRKHDVSGTGGYTSTRGYTFTAFNLQHSLLLPFTATYSGSYVTYLALFTIFYSGTSKTAPAVSSYSVGTALGAGSTSAVAGSGALNVSGELETWSFMANVWYDFNLGDSPLHPFIGGGIGLAHASLEYNLSGTIPDGANGLFGPVSASYRGNGEATDWGFAYQLGAGLGYDLGNGMMLSAQYRYFNTGAMDLSLADQIEINLESHNFMVGLNIPIGGGM